MKRLAFLLIGAALTSLAYSATFVMPKDLVQFAETNGCLQIADFFDRPGSINPPYLYMDSQSDAPAILWCKKREAPTPTPYLLLLKDNPEVGKGCSNKIEWWNPPGGLTVRKIRSLALADFRYLNPRDKRPPSSKTSGAAIVSSYDGVEAIFYCYQGNWLYTIKH